VLFSSLVPNQEIGCEEGLQNDLGLCRITYYCKVTVGVNKPITPSDPNHRYILHFGFLFIAD